VCPPLKKQFWNYIRNTKKDRLVVAPLRSDGLLVDDTKEKAEILNRQYFSVFTPENTDEQLFLCLSRVVYVWSYLSFL
jgi:hypothetical protein